MQSTHKTSRYNAYSSATVVFFAIATAPVARGDVIITLTDDHGYGDLGCFGGKEVQIPNIDRMAREAVRFTDFYAAAPLGLERVPQAAGAPTASRSSETPNRKGRTR